MPRLLALLVSFAIQVSAGTEQAIAQPIPPSIAQDSASAATPKDEGTVKGLPNVPQETTEPKAPIGPPPKPPIVTMECLPKPVPIAAPVTCEVTITHSPKMTVQVTAPLSAESGAASLPKAG